LTTAGLAFAHQQVEASAEPESVFGPIKAAAQ
jgi:hypothetical protein